MTQASVAQTGNGMAALAKLINSEPAKALALGRHSVSEDQMGASAKEYARVALELGVSPLYWALPGRGVYGSPQGAMSRFMAGPLCAKPLQALADAGASPWMEQMAAGGGKIHWVSAAQMAVYAMGQRRGNLTTRLVALKSAVETAIQARAAGAEVEELFASLASQYFAVASRSSKTSKGVLGPADKDAKDCAGILMRCEAGLVELAGSLEPLDLKDRRLALIEPALKDARERHAAKVDKSAAVNPEKLKKQLSEAQKARLLSLITLCRDHANDPQLIEMAFESTEWLAQTPMAASVRVGREGSLFAAALLGGSQAAIEGLEKAGANIWLAAAQSGVANACFWVAQSLAHRWAEEADLAPFARLLLRGAWLDGAPDPKGRCVELAAAAAAEFAQNPYNKRPADKALSLGAELERQTLEELLVPGPDAAAPEPAEPKRRSAL